MKRFLIFVIISIVSLGIGFTVFRFMTYDEVMSVTQTVYQVNVGEQIKLDVITEHLKRGTVISTELSQSGETLQKIDDFTFTAKDGGQAVITIESSSGLMPIKVQVTVGNGANATPYFIKDAETLMSIGKTVEGSSVFMSLSSSYMVLCDISLSNVVWQPIGAEDSTGFTGRFDFNGHKISGLNVTAQGEDVGLFAKTGVDAQIFNGTLINSTVLADATNAGALVGQNNGDITNVTVIDGSIKSTKQNAVVGGLVGVNHGGIYNCGVSAVSVYAEAEGGIAGGLVGVSQTNSMRAIVALSSANSTVSAHSVAGGLAGKVVGAIVENCYTGALETTEKISSANSECYIGGVVGVLEGANSNVAVIKDTYAAIGLPTSNNQYVGAIIGQNKNIDATNKNKIYGNYYSNETTGVSNGVAGMVDPTEPHANDFGVYKTTKQNLISSIPSNYKDANKITPVGNYYSCASLDGTVNYYWNFENLWQSNANEGQLPTIRPDAVYTSTNLEYAGIQGAVNSFETFASLMSNPNGNYKLTGDFTIDRTKTYAPFDFNGTLVGSVKEDGTPTYTITFVVDSEEQMLDGKIALFKTLGKNAIIQNVAVAIRVENLSANSAAALAVSNKGKVLNCHASGAITTSVSATTQYVAGLVAENFGAVEGSTSNVDIQIDGAPANIFAGGVVAYNYAGAFVENCKNTGDISGTANTTGYIGGIVGQADSKVTSCANKGSINMAGKLANCYVGGVVGNANGSHISKCSSSNNSIKATNVGGVVGYTTGYVTECMSNSTLTGDYVGGIVCVITTNYITNCLSLNNLVGLSDNSIICGIGYSFNIYQKASYATHIFSACTFGQGKKYYESASDVRQGDDWFVNYELCLESSIYVNDIATAERSVASGEIFAGFLNWVGSWTSADIAGYRFDCPVSDAQAKGSDSYAAFYENGFSTDIWLFDGSNYPALKNVAK